METVSVREVKGRTQCQGSAPRFMETEGSLRASKEPDSGPCTERFFSSIFYSNILMDTEEFKGNHCHHFFLSCCFLSVSTNMIFYFKVDICV
jgi:hypothetical protein